VPFFLLAFSFKRKSYGALFNDLQLIFEQKTVKQPPE